MDHDRVVTQPHDAGLLRLEFGQAMARACAGKPSLSAYPRSALSTSIQAVVISATWRLTVRASAASEEAKPTNESAARAC